MFINAFNGSGRCERKPHILSVERSLMRTVNRCEPSVVLRARYRAPETEGAPTAVATEALAPVRIEELHVIVRTL